MPFRDFVFADVINFFHKLSVEVHFLELWNLNNPPGTTQRTTKPSSKVFIAHFQIRQNKLTCHNLKVKIEGWVFSKLAHGYSNICLPEFHLHLFHLSLKPLPEHSAPL